MSDTDDCASQEIEANTSSNSTRNSKKHHFIQSILNSNDSQTLLSHGSGSSEKLARIPLLEKRDFIKNWIIAHSRRSSEKTCPLSPILGISPAKRSPQSPILGYQRKRIKREANSKENCRVSLNKKFQKATPDPQVTARITIENENPRYGRSIHCTNSDSDKTLTSVTSPVLSRITKSPTLNASKTSRRSYRLGKSKNSEKSDADSTLKWNTRRSLIRESSKGPESLSLSSPLGERNECRTIQNTANASNEPSQKMSELLVEESPLELEIISSSSKIPETLSLSTTVNECEETEVVSKPRNDLKEEEIGKEEKLHHTPSRSSRIKVEAEKSFGDVRRNHVHTTSNSSDGLSVSPTLGKNKLTDVNINKFSRTRAGNRLAKIAAPGTLQNLDHFNIIPEFCNLPDTLSVSSQLDGNLVIQSLNSAMRLPSPLPLVSKAPAGVKPRNSSWIRAKGSSTKIAKIANQRCIDGPSSIREKSSKLSNGLSQRIDAESVTTNAPEDEIKIESDSDATVSDFIENPETQNAAVLLRNSYRVAKPDMPQDGHTRIVGSTSKSHRDRSCDSDETYYSDGESVPRLQATAIAYLKNSQRISQTTSHSAEGRVSATRSEIISLADSPVRHNNSEPLANAALFTAINNSNKKKKKGKKGSLLAKLQAIVSSQVSNLHIWHYQMTQPDFKDSRTQFVTLKIRERETRYGRHYLTASVIEDSHKLLKNLFETESILSSKKSESSSAIKIVTLMIVPEIVGAVKIPAASTLKLYPPWEIMDRLRKILSITYFKVIAATDDNIESETTKIGEEMRIIEEFDCPCIRANKLVDSCCVKFSNTKPSIMQEMFGT